MNKLENTHIVIMAGGGGTRFWPLSRNSFPKQFLELMGGKSMLRHTVDRIATLVDHDKIWILTNHLYKDLITIQIPEIPEKNIIIEPIRRDTAGAIMLATAIISAVSENATMFVMPADHMITPNDIFEQTICIAHEYIETNKTLFTFGIPPTNPSPQFGYIKVGKKINDKNIWDVNKFVEKPTVEVAKKYLATKQYYWNSGIFAWKTKTICDKFVNLLPKHAEGIVKLKESWNTSNWSQNLEEVFSEISSISIDYGIMEKSSDVVLLEASFVWDDVGSWEALESLYVGENIVIGKHVGIETKNCIVHSEKQLVATIGVENLVVVATDDAILVVPKDQTAKVKELVNFMNKNDLQEYL